MIKYQIIGKEGFVIGRFKEKEDRDIAIVRYCNYGFANEIEK